MDSATIASDDKIIQLHAAYHGAPRRFMVRRVFGRGGERNDQMAGLTLKKYLPHQYRARLFFLPLPCVIRPCVGKRLHANLTLQELKTRQLLFTVLQLPMHKIIKAQGAASREMIKLASWACSVAGMRKMLRL